MNGGLLLHSPVEYFREFERRRASRWVALGSFLLIAVVEAADVGEMPRRSELLGALLGITLNWIFGAVFFGALWFFLGAKILGGRGTLDTTVRAVGYAFLWPGIMSLVTVILTGAIWRDSQAAFLGSVALRLALGLWSLCLAAIAVKYTHSLTWVRAVLVVLWMPIALLALVAVVATGAALIGMARAG